MIFFGGSYVRDIRIKGPSPYSQSLIWTTNQQGEPIAEIPYPGNQYGEKDDGRPYTEVSGKSQQAINAQGALPNDNVDLIGYSAGTESALMYAEWRLENGQGVDSIVLLGPTFETSEMNFDNPDGGWGAVMDGLIEQGVNIYVLDDGIEPNAAAEYVAPTGNGYGVWEYNDELILHNSTHPNWKLLQGTNNSPRIKKEIYSWLVTPQ